MLTLKKEMGTTIEYNTELALGDEIVFNLDGEKFTGKVDKVLDGYYVNFSGDGCYHSEIVDKIFSHFGISDRYDFRDRVTGRNWNGPSGIWPCTSSLEELKKMLDAL